MKGTIIDFVGNPIILFFAGIIIVILIVVLLFSFEYEPLIDFFKGFA